MKTKKILITSLCLISTSIFITKDFIKEFANGKAFLPSKAQKRCSTGTAVQRSRNPMPNQCQFVHQTAAVLLFCGLNVGLLPGFVAAQDLISPEKPNILIINIDDMGWRDVGFMGSEYYETPNIDKLAREGIIFTNGYATATNCSPSRASLMTGQWSPRHGILTVRTSFRGESKYRRLIPIETKTTLPDNKVTLADVLRNAGYVTCHAGKWNISDNPLKNGFDYNIGGSLASNPGSYYPPYGSHVDLEPPSDDYYLTNLIMDKALDFVKSTGKQPFFLYYSPFAVHTPIQPYKELLPKYENKHPWNGQDNAEYATMIENLDTQIGRLISFLKEEGKLDHTFILFTSDNGGDYRITKQWPLRSGKGSYYEGGIRKPMFVKWHGKVKEGTTSEIPVSNLDFFPTCLDVAGVERPDNIILDGQSLMPLLTGKGSFADRPLFWHFPFYLQPFTGSQVEEGNHTQDPLFRTRPGSAVRLGNWKLIQYFEYNDLELYNLKEDISEKNNLAEKKPEKLNELLKILEDWREEVKAPVPVELNPEYIGK
jgi:arylsulfatase A-like enzyme